MVKKLPFFFLWTDKVDKKPQILLNSILYETQNNNFYYISVAVMTLMYILMHDFNINLKALESKKFWRDFFFKQTVFQSMVENEHRNIEETTAELNDNHRRAVNFVLKSKMSRNTACETFIGLSSNKDNELNWDPLTIWNEQQESKEYILIIEQFTIKYAREVDWFYKNFLPQVLLGTLGKTKELHIIIGELTKKYGELPRKESIITPDTFRHHSPWNTVSVANTKENDILFAHNPHEQAAYIAHVKKRIQVSLGHREPIYKLITLEVNDNVIADIEKLQKIRKYHDLINVIETSYKPLDPHSPIKIKEQKTLEGHQLDYLLVHLTQINDWIRVDSSYSMPATPNKEKKSAEIVIIVLVDFERNIKSRTSRKAGLEITEKVKLSHGAMLGRLFKKSPRIYKEGVKDAIVKKLVEGFKMMIG